MRFGWLFNGLAFLFSGEDSDTADVPPSDTQIVPPQSSPDRSDNGVLSDVGVGFVPEDGTPRFECQLELDVRCIPRPGSTSCNSTMPPVEQCWGRPFEMEFLFNGGTCEQSYNVQEPSGKFLCSDVDGIGPSYQKGDGSFIIITDLSGLTVLYAGWAEVGSIFRLSDGGDRFPADMMITLYGTNDTSDPGNIQQAIQFHSSCSLNLFVNDRFGALQLVSFVNEEQGLVTLLQNQSFELDIMYTGQPATVASLTIDSNVDPFFFNVSSSLAGYSFEARDRYSVPLSIPILLTTFRIYNLQFALVVVNDVGEVCVGSTGTSFSTGYPLPPTFPTFSPTQAPSELITPTPLPTPPPTPTMTQSPAEYPSSCVLDLAVACSQDCNTNAPPQFAQCEGRPFEISFVFRGGDCEGSHNTQPVGDKFTCQDFGGGPPVGRGEQSYIVVTALKDDTLYYEGWVAVGDRFTLFDGGNSFVADQLITIYSSDDTSNPYNVIQSMQYHSSCSQNLFLADQFGSVQLVGWINEEQGPLTTFANQTFDLDVTVPIDIPGSTATLMGLTVDSTVSPGFFDFADQVAGIVMAAGDSLSVSVTIPQDLSSRMPNKISATVAAIADSGTTCMATHEMSYPAGYPDPLLAPTVPPNPSPSRTVQPTPPPTPEPTPEPTPVPTPPPTAPPAVSPCIFDLEVSCIPPPGASSCNNTPPPVDQCTGRPFEMVFLFNGGTCDQSYNVQGASGRFFCDDFNGGPPTEPGEKSFIVVTALKDDTLYHSDWVDVGSLFTLSDGGNNFVADQLITIYRDDNINDPSNILQSVQYHSSCAQNLFLKDRFGASQVVIWINEDQGVVSCFANQTFDLEMTVPIDLVGGPATIQSFTVASNVDPFFFNYTNKLNGIVVDAGDTLQTSLSIPVDLTAKKTYNLLITVLAITADGKDCRATQRTSFTAGYPLPPIFPTFSPTQAPSGTRGPRSTPPPAPFTPPTVEPPCVFDLDIVCIPRPGFQDCNATPPAPEQCEARPFEMSFVYRGGNCSNSQNSQTVGDKFTCGDYGGGPPMYRGEQSYIVVTALKDDTLYHEGWVTVGDLFTLSDGGNNFVADQLITIYNSADIYNPANILQSVQYHSSCAQNLFLNDRFGAVQLVGWINEDQGTVTAFANQTFDLTYKIPSNIPGMATLTSFTVASNIEPFFFDQTTQVFGVLKRPGSTLSTSFMIPTDLTSRKTYNLLTTVAFITETGTICRGTELTSFTAGYSNQPLFPTFPPTQTPSMIYPTYLPTPAPSGSPNSYAPAEYPFMTVGPTPTPSDAPFPYWAPCSIDMRVACVPPPGLETCDDMRYMFGVSSGLQTFQLVAASNSSGMEDFMGGMLMVEGLFVASNVDPFFFDLTEENYGAYFGYGEVFETRVSIPVDWMQPQTYNLLFVLSAIGESGQTCSTEALATFTTGSSFPSPSYQTPSEAPYHYPVYYPTPPPYPTDHSYCGLEATIECATSSGLSCQKLKPPKDLVCHSKDGNIESLSFRITGRGLLDEYELPDHDHDYPDYDNDMPGDEQTSQQFDFMLPFQIQWNIVTAEVRQPRDEEYEGLRKATVDWYTVEIALTYDGYGSFVFHEIDCELENTLYRPREDWPHQVVLGCIVTWHVFAREETPDAVTFLLAMNEVSIVDTFVKPHLLIAEPQDPPSIFQSSRRVSYMASQHPDIEYAPPMQQSSTNNRDDYKYQSRQYGDEEHDYDFNGYEGEVHSEYYIVAKAGDYVVFEGVVALGETFTLGEEIERDCLTVTISSVRHGAVPGYELQVLDPVHFTCRGREGQDITLMQDIGPFSVVSFSTAEQGTLKAYEDIEVTYRIKNNGYVPATPLSAITYSDFQRQRYDLLHEGCGTLSPGSEFTFTKPFQINLLEVSGSRFSIYLDLVGETETGMECVERKRMAVGVSSSSTTPAPTGLPTCYHIPYYGEEPSYAPVGMGLPDYGEAPSPAPNGTAVRSIVSRVAMFGGSEWGDASSYQYKAITWLESDPLSQTLSDQRIQQRYALACIYYATYAVRTIYTVVEPRGWIDSSGWVSGQSECTWFGIQCDGNSMVDKIILASNRITGSFPSETAILAPSLTRLDLFRNSVYNSGDEGNGWLGELYNLRELFYGQTNFEYNGIPPQISNLVNLVEYDCSFTLYFGPLVGSVFQPLQKLEYLVLSGNAFNSSIPVEIGQLPNLEMLYVQNSFVDGDLSFMEPMKSIIECWVDQNPGLRGTIPSFIGQIQSLQSWSVTRCGLTGQIPTELGNLRNMVRMWMYDNMLTGTVPAELGNMFKLQTLELEANLLTGTMPLDLCLNRIPMGLLATLEADCGGNPPEIACDCCTCCENCLPA